MSLILPPPAAKANVDVNRDIITPREMRAVFEKDLKLLSLSLKIATFHCVPIHTVRYYHTLITDHTIILSSLVRSKYSIIVRNVNPPPFFSTGMGRDIVPPLP